MQSNNSNDKPEENKTEGSNTLHKQWGFTPSTFFTAMVDYWSQTIDHSNMNEWVKLAHATASQHKIPNYMGARVKVVSQLDVKQWRHLLADYKFSRVCDYVEFGFPLTLNYKDFTYNTEVNNHPSAIQFPQAVKDYLVTEISYNVMVGPFDTHPPPLKNFTSPNDDKTQARQLSQNHN